MNIDELEAKLREYSDQGLDVNMTFKNGLVYFEAYKQMGIEVEGMSIAEALERFESELKKP